MIEHRDDVDAKACEPGRIVLNLHVDDFDKTAAQLQAVGVSWPVPLADRPAGRFGIFADIDGNYVQIIQFNESVESGP